MLLVTLFAAVYKTLVTVRDVHEQTLDSGKNKFRSLQTGWVIIKNRLNPQVDTYDGSLMLSHSLRHIPNIKLTFVLNTPYFSFVSLKTLQPC